MLTMPSTVQVNVNMKSSAGMTIGELAGRFGLATHVLRHWEAMGLLRPARRSNGRRVFGEEHLTSVAMIQAGKEAGFSLQQMRDFLAIRDRSARQDLLRDHLAQLDRRIAELRTAREMVAHTVSCPSENFLECPEVKRMVAARIPPPQRYP